MRMYKAVFIQSKNTRKSRQTPVPSCPIALSGPSAHTRLLV